MLLRQNKETKVFEIFFNEEEEFRAEWKASKEDLWTHLTKSQYTKKYSFADRLSLYTNIQNDNDIIKKDDLIEIEEGDSKCTLVTILCSKE